MRGYALYYSMTLKGGGMNGKVPFQPDGAGFGDQGVTLGTGPTIGRREVKAFEFNGDHYEMGYQQGLQLREAISFFSARLSGFEVVQASRPPVVPARAYVYTWPPTTPNSANGWKGWSRARSSGNPSSAS